ncbi:hypothetical protein GGX14DRAFT_580816 [Mycena pura]|uniref:Mug135-like C-terminal domain-containing protein n=1 Tax=Mycena pura TaxID=153505 RepID=A0AAD6Y2X4_9AGAR|nr:hypothetical protein GGX14DRAFT_580816 [Mycena pura]
MPIQPPPLPLVLQNTVNLPHPLHDPPIATEVGIASELKAQAAIHRSHNRITQDELGQIASFEYKVVAAHTSGDAAPPWFDRAMDNKLKPINDRLTRIENKLNRALIFAVVSHNLRLGDGKFANQPFEMVPFKNGTEPNKDPNNLPILRDIDALQALDDADLTAYYRGYGGRGNASAPTRKDFVRNAIGCSINLG